MKTLQSLKNEIEAARELLAQAEKDYRDGIIRAIEDGRVEEVVEAEWKERWVQGKLKVYCSNCKAFSPSDFRTPGCPNCRAKMSGGRRPGSWLPKFAESTQDSSFGSGEALDQEDTPQQKSLTAIPHAYGEDDDPVKEISIKCDNPENDDISHAMRQAQQALYDIKKAGVKETVMAERIKVAKSTMNNWMHGKNLPSYTYCKDIMEMYKELFGKYPDFVRCP